MIHDATEATYGSFRPILATGATNRSSWLALPIGYGVLLLLFIATVASSVNDYQLLPIRRSCDA
jgi:hypothetical protein